MRPDQTEHRVYGMFPNSEPDPFVARDMVVSRLAFADRSAFARDAAEHPERPAPSCSKCTEDPDLTYTVRRDARRDPAVLDARGRLSATSIEALMHGPGSR